MTIYYLLITYYLLLVLVIHPRVRHRRLSLRLRLVHHDGLSGQQFPSNGRRVLQRGPGHFHGVNDAGNHQIFHSRFPVVGVKSAKIWDGLRPEFSAIWRSGTSSDLRIMPTPSFSELGTVDANSSSLGAILARGAPPPATMPSSTAALVALSASSILNFFSFISVSVAAPTLITATPPANRARRSCNFSFSKSESVSSISRLI